VHAEGYLRRSRPGWRHISNQDVPLVLEMENTIHQGSPKVVVERHDCRNVADLEHQLVPGILPVVVVYGQSSAESVGTSLGFVVDTAAAAAAAAAVAVAVAVLQPQNHTASVVEEAAGHVAVEGTNARPAVCVSQLQSSFHVTLKPCTCFPPDIAPYVSGLYPPAACCGG
jgi:hypothetical protein